MWNPAPPGHSSVQWTPAPSMPGGLISGGPGYGGPLGSSDSDMIWDEARGGYWVKETIVDEGNMHNEAMGMGGYGGGYGQISGGNMGGYGLTSEWGGRQQCKGCTAGHVQNISSSGMMSSRQQVPQTNLFVLPCSGQHSSCKCSSKSSSTAFPVVQQSMYRSTVSTCGGNRCSGSSHISCGCHSSLGCNKCGAYH